MERVDFDVTGTDGVSLASLDVSETERFRTNTHGAVFAALRRLAPVHYCASSPYGPYWSITRLDDIVAVEADPETFSSEGNVIIGDVAVDFEAPAFATSDPPIHTVERRAATGAVTPGRIAELEVDLRASIAEILDALPRSVPFDWVSRVSLKITSATIATLFEWPKDEPCLLPHWCEVTTSTPLPGGIVETVGERTAILEQYWHWLDKTWRARSRETPRGDVMSCLAHDPGTASMLDNRARLMGAVTLVAGANEASRGALTGAVVAFDQFPREWARLKANPALAVKAAAEIVRWQSPITHMRRTAKADIVFCGRQIRRGDKVVLWYCSGNRDESYFEAGDALIIDRANLHRHAGYGFGIHRCFGRRVADMQLRVLLEELIRRFERLEIVEEPIRIASNFQSGYERVQVRAIPRG
jgi:cytochrome P450